VSNRRRRPLKISLDNQILVFVSHSSEDAYVARHMASDILSCGAQCFLDISNISVGENFEKKIRQTLTEAHELVVLVTPWALKPYIWLEIGAAWLREISTVVVLLGLTPKEFQAHPDFPVHLKSLNIITLNEFDKYLGQLKKRVRAR